MAWVTPEELEVALGTPTYLALFDDDQDGAANLAIVNQILKAAHADTLRFATRGYDNAVPAIPSDELWTLELDFAQARSLMRGDTYLRDKGQDLYKTTEETGRAIASGLQRGSSTMPNPTPVLAEPVDGVGESTASLVDFSGSSGGLRPASYEFWRREKY